jgi:hypothetical protein
MIRDQELLHGAALIRLVDSGVPVSICKADGVHQSAYVVEIGDRRVALLIKLSTKKKSPWQFTFTEVEGDALAALEESYPHHERLLVFVCHLDGVCCLPHALLAEIMDDPNVPAGQAVSIARGDGRSYRVTGPGRTKLSRTIPMNDWPRRVLAEETS